MKKLLITIFMILFSLHSFGWMNIRMNVDNGGCFINDNWISVLDWSELTVNFDDCDNRQWFKNLFGWL